MVASMDATDAAPTVYPGSALKIFKRRTFNTGDKGEITAEA
jgi:hypothetical protein